MSKHVLSLVGLGILSWLLMLVVCFMVGHLSRDVNASNFFSRAFVGISLPENVVPTEIAPVLTIQVAKGISLKLIHPKNV